MIRTSNPDFAALIKIAQSPAGQKLLSMLRSSGTDLDRIASAAASGNLEEAKQSLSSMLSSREAQELLRQLEEGLDKNKTPKMKKFFDTLKDFFD